MSKVQPMEWETMTKQSTVFLAGPPGVGKTTLGQQVCERLQWAFVDVTDPTPDLAVIKEASPPLIALPWSWMQDRKTKGAVRRKGTLMGLWIHPLRLIERSDYRCTPSRAMKTHGGFGRTGTATREFRLLDRACDVLFDLGTLTIDESVELLYEHLCEAPQEAGPDLGHWAQDWISDHDAPRKSAERLANVMASYLQHLEQHGTSPRKMSGICSDLQAASMLVFRYERPNTTRVLLSFQYGAPHEIEFRRKFTDSSNQVRRYTRNLEAFEQFLLDQGLLSKD